MVYSRTWDETDPANGALISEGAQEIREGKIDVRERLNTLLTDGTTPVPPVTIANLDTRLSTNVDPAWIMGDQVDLRGCPWRASSVATDSGNRVNTTTSWIYIEATNLTLTYTPVSSASLLVFIFMGYVTAGSNTVNSEIRVVNVTAGDTVIGQVMATRAVDVWVTHIVTLTGISASTTFRPQFRIGSGGLSSTRTRGDLMPTVFRLIELV